MGRSKLIDCRCFLEPPRHPSRCHSSKPKGVRVAHTLLAYDLYESAHDASERVDVRRKQCVELVAATRERLVKTAALIDAAAERFDLNETGGFDGRFRKVVHP